MNMFQRFFYDLMKWGLERFGLYYGEYDGVCTNNEDPGEQGRIKVTCPGVAGNTEIGAWAWPRFMWSGRDSGTYFIPDRGDPVTVTFRNGKPSFPMYTGGSWPNVDGSDNFFPANVYVNGVPYTRGIKTKSGHELSFCDDPDNRNIRFVWHDGEDKYSFFSIKSTGSVQIANHRGAFMEMRADDNDDLNMLVDSRGNSFIQDKEGIKIAESNGNFISLAEKLVQLIGKENMVLNAQGVNIKSGSVILGDNAGQNTIRGSYFFNWLSAFFMPYFLSHTHGTGVGPSGPPLPPIPPVVQSPSEKDMVTDKVKVP